MTHKKHKKFSVKKRLLSFKYAFRGIGFMIQTQHNARIHLIATIIVIFLGVTLKVSLTEWCLLIFAIGIVLSSELFNTSIEFLTDLLSPEYQKRAGMVKDIAAGAMLISAITSAIIGLIVFLPRVIHFIS
ncbi:MAG: diacylglycerol kinase family protein [Bacteroidetes bacterium]|nr:diacylglycerol kinase family protein [Bacteroidota bacterium]MBL7103347.1 diacylglycerol kinase family protein [Bacteroidales bacterium]